MDYDRLWAPWRMQYVSGDATRDDHLPQPQAWHDGADHDCFLCRDAAAYDAAQADRTLLVASRGAHTLVVLNRYPYNNGHVLIAPLRHISDLAELTHDEHLECMESLSRLTQFYRTRMHADGFNVGLNLGRAAGAGLEGHLHWHLVPRWSGDSNFMPVLAGVRVIPQSLDALWELLANALGSGS